MGSPTGRLRGNARTAGTHKAVHAMMKPEETMPASVNLSHTVSIMSASALSVLLGWLQTEPGPSQPSSAMHFWAIGGHQLGLSFHTWPLGRVLH